MKIRFKGKEYLFINRNGSNDLSKGGAIATEEQFVNGICSAAHLYPDGVIREYGREIGTIADLEVIDHSPLPDPSFEAIFNTLLDHWEDD